MYGRAGIFSLHAGGVAQDLLRRMTDTLHHRGPDDSDLRLDESAGLSRLWTWPAPHGQVLDQTHCQAPGEAP